MFPCPKCSHPTTIVISTRVDRRERACLSCAARFMTVESYCGDVTPRPRLGRGKKPVQEAVPDFGEIFQCRQQIDEVDHAQADLG